MTVQVVTDSSSDLPAELVARYGIAVVPLYINIGKKSYRDGIDMTHEQFYAGLPHFESHPKTSVPGTGQLVQVYEQLARAGATDIISIHIGSALSAMVSVARLAAQETSAARVAVFDSGQLTVGTGLLVLTAARAAAEGCTAADILAMLEDQAARTYSVAALDTLEYLRRSGRLNHFQTTLASVLHIKPVLRMHGGHMDMERVRTRSGAWARVLELLNELAPFEKLTLVYTHDLHRAHLLHEQASHLIPDGQELAFAPVTPVIGAHIGPGGVGFVGVQARRGPDRR